MSTSICSLCKEQKTLKKSHIIPKFVGAWIKKTSVTGRMRAGMTPNKRVQDLNKDYLFCGECEQIFSRFEKYFSEKIFKPFLNANNPIIEYNEYLRKFTVSILWRLLIYFYPEVKWKNNKNKAAAENMETTWRNYLYSDVNLIDDQLYMLMLKMVPDAKPIEGTTLDINWYFYRSTDGTIAQSDDESFVYVKIPGFAFFASLNNNPLQYFKNCHILNNGSFNFNTQDVELTIFRFLYQRSRVALSPSSKMSQTQRERIKEDYEKYKDKIEKSFGMQIYLAKQLHKK